MKRQDSSKRSIEIAREAEEKSFDFDSKIQGFIELQRFEKLKRVPDLDLRYPQITIITTTRLS